MQVARAVMVPVTPACFLTVHLVVFAPLTPAGTMVVTAATVQRVAMETVALVVPIQPGCLARVVLGRRATA